MAGTNFIVFPKVVHHLFFGIIIKLLLSDAGADTVSRSKADLHLGEVNNSVSDSYNFHSTRELAISGFSITSCSQDQRPAV